jgi:hypothetical protein
MRDDEPQSLRGQVRNYKKKFTERWVQKTFLESEASGLMIAIPI